jgi:hypothetical protein
MKTKIESDRAKILTDTDSFFKNGGKITECITHRTHIECEIAHVTRCYSITNTQKATRLAKLELERECG